MADYDVAVVGLGAMGSGALLQLARRGVPVIGFDRLAPPHAMGSSHGETRITRLAIGEGDHLTPLVMRSHALWREIEGESGMSLLSEVGGLIVSSDKNAAQTHVAGFFENTIAAAQRFAIPHELLDASQIRQRWPQLNVREDERGYFEPTAGFVRPEACVGAQLTLAQRYGAAIHGSETVLSFESGRDRVTVATDKGRYTADRVILAAGAWLPQLLEDRYARLFQIYRQVQFWFAVEDAARFVPQCFPVFIWELQNSKRGLYGFPALGGEAAIKLASEEFEHTTTPNRVSRNVAAEEITQMRALVSANLRGVGPECVKVATCLYTVTPDFGFIIDTHPECERVIVASPCSGHGFKHSAAIGDALADIALGQSPRFDLAPFGFRRLSS